MEGGRAGMRALQAGGEQAFCRWTEPGSPASKCIIYEDEPMHIYELIAFQGQLWSVKNPCIMNYCPRGGPGFRAGLKPTKLLQSVKLALKKMLPTGPAFGQTRGDAEKEAFSLGNSSAPTPSSIPGKLRQASFPPKATCTHRGWNSVTGPPTPQMTHGKSQTPLRLVLTPSGPPSSHQDADASFPQL